MGSIYQVSEENNSSENLLRNLLQFINFMPNPRWMLFFLLAMDAIQKSHCANPEVANPIDDVILEPGEQITLELNTNAIFFDADGDEFSVAAITVNGNEALPDWALMRPKKTFGRDYALDTRATYVVNNTAFIANGIYGLLVYNVIDPESYTFLNSHCPPNPNQHSFFDITVDAGYAFLAVAGYGLQIWNIANPMDLKFTAGYQTNVTTDTARLIKRDNIIYLAAGKLYTFDVANLTRPNLLNYTNSSIQNCVDVSTDNATLYAACDDVIAFDASIPEAPEYISRLPLFNPATNVISHNNLVFATDSGAGAYSLNYSDPEQPVIIDSSAQISTSGLTGYEDYLLHAAEDSGLGVHDISNPSQLRYDGAHKTLDYANDVAIFNQHIYVSSRHEGMKVLPLSVIPPSLNNWTSDLPYGNAADVVVSDDNIAVIANTHISLSTYNVSDISDIKYLDSHDVYENDPGSSTTIVKTKNKIAYAEDYGTRRITANDISEPTNITTSDYYYGPSQFSRINQFEITDSHLFTSNSGGNAEIQIFDRNNISNTLPIGRYVAATSSLSVEGELLCASGLFPYLDMMLIDIRDKTNPTLISATPIDYTVSISLHGNYTYLSQQQQGLRIFDIASRVNPVLAAVHDTPGSTHQTLINGEIAYLADETGVHSLRITNPGSPAFLNAFDVPGSSKRIAVHQNALHIAAGPAGLQVHDLGIAELSMTMPANLTPPIYTFTLHAVNSKNEWIDTTFRVSDNSTQLPTAQSSGETTHTSKSTSSTTSTLSSEKEQSSQTTRTQRASKITSTSQKLADSWEKSSLFSSTKRTSGATETLVRPIIQDEISVAIFTNEGTYLDPADFRIFSDLPAEQELVLINADDYEFYINGVLLESDGAITVGDLLDSGTVLVTLKNPYACEEPSPFAIETADGDRRLEILTEAEISCIHAERFSMSIATMTMGL